MVTGLNIVCMIQYDVTAVTRVLSPIITPSQSLGIWNIVQLYIPQIYAPLSPPEIYTLIHEFTAFKFRPSPNL